MPGMSGFTLHKMKEVDIKPRVWVISAFEDLHEEFRRRFPHLDFNCFLHKPITRRKLVEQIKAQLDPSNACYRQRSHYPE
jgi:YesN/AraC family two-component response regulator